MDLYYPQFDVITIDSDGFRVVADGEDIDFYNITQDVLIDTLTTDADGIIPGGFFSSPGDPVADGDIVELRHDTHPGTCRFTLKTTALLAVEAVENHIATLVLDNDFDDQESDTAVVLVADLSNPTVEPRAIGDAILNGETAIPFTATEGQQLRVYAGGKQKDFQFNAASIELLSSLDITATSGESADTAPTFTDVTYDSANSEVDLVFVKNGTAVGDIKVEYRQAGTSSWTLHGTDFAHGATGGSVVITEQPTPVTYDFRLYQDGVTGYSDVKQVTVDASGGGSTPPSDLIAVRDDLGGCEYDINLSWTAGGGAANYTVERKIGSGSFSVLAGSVAGTSYSDAGLIASMITSTTYTYRVKQNDVTGYSNNASRSLPKCYE